MTCFLRVSRLLHQVALALGYMYASAMERTFNKKIECASVTYVIDAYSLIGRKK